jgi:hypothetical protein
VDPELPGVGEGIKLTPEFRTFFQSYENRGILRSEDGCPLVFSVMHSERLFELVHSYSPPTKSIVLRDDAELRAAFQARFPVREIKDIDPAEKDFDF